MNETIKKFVEQMIVDKDIHNVSDEVMTQIKSDLYNRAEDIINAHILKNMPENKLSEFESLLNTGSDVEIQNFCSIAIPNLDAVVAGALLSFRDVYLQTARK